MKKTNKKGFTIVELVIVIAVVAILAAVLIPTFVSITKKANESKDTQLVRNLNTALAVDTEVGKHETMQSALEAAAKAGYDVAKINTSATDNEILWDSKNDCFVYKKDSGIEYIPNSKTEEATDGDFWKIVADASAAAANKKYNSYVMGTAELGDMTVANGLDVGENTVKGTITFESNETKTVTIRTNGGTLAVNAPKATVKHYGKADKITITAVAGRSYHEYGEVLGNIELADGRVVMETGSKAAAIKVNADAAKITDGTAVVSVDTTASAVSVVVPAEVKTAIEGKEGNGITASEDKIVTDSTVIENMDKFAGGLGTEESPYLIGSLDELRKVGELSVSKPTYIRQISDIEIVGDSSLFKNASSDYSVIYKFNGVYDGNNHSIINKVKVSGATTWYSFIYHTYGNTRIENMNVYLGTSWFNIVSDSKSNSLTFDNINFYNQNNTVFDIAGNNYGLLVSYTRDSKFYASHVNNYANINNNEFASGLFVGAWFLNNETKFTDCNNYANWNGSCGFFNGNISYVNRFKGSYDNLTVTDCHNYGMIVGAKVNLLGKDISATESKEIELKETNNFNGLYIMAQTNGIIRKTLKGEIELSNIAGATKYVLTMYIHYSGENQINGGFVLTQTYDKEGLTEYNVVKFIDSVTATKDESLGLANYKSGKKCYDETNNMYYYYIETSNGNYYVFDEPLTIDGDKMVLNGYPRCTVMVYNNDQLIAYEIVNANNILSK